MILISNLAVSSEAALCKIPFALRLVLLAFFLLLLAFANLWRGWSKEKSRPVSPMSSTSVAGRLRRPSNLLILLGVAVCVYWGLHEPCPGPRFWFFFGVITIVVGRIFNRWEQEANKS